MKARRLRSETNLIILQTIAIAGAIVVSGAGAVFAQNLVKRGLFKKHHKPCYFLKRLEYLKNNRYLQKTPDGKLELSKKGRMEMEHLSVFARRSDRQDKWDGKWFILSFDIKECVRRLRDELRIELINYGFIRLQNSLWVYPYDCADFIALLKADLLLGRSVICFKAEMLDSDRELRELFDLD